MTTLIRSFFLWNVFVGVATKDTSTFSNAELLVESKTSDKPRIKELFFMFTL